MKKSIFVALALSAPLASAQTELIPGKADVPEAEKIYSPYVERTVQDKNLAEGLYWGDTHLHSNYSSDSGMIGNKLSSRKPTDSPKARKYCPARVNARDLFVRWTFWSSRTMRKTSD